MKLQKLTCWYLISRHWLPSIDMTGRDLKGFAGANGAIGCSLSGPEVRTSAQKGSAL